VLKKKLFMFNQYVQYRLHAKTTHGTHSPFVFDLLKKVIYNPHSFYAYLDIESCRKQLSQSKEYINCHDLGAGGQDEGYKSKPIRKIVKGSVKPAKYGQLLFRLVNYFQAKTALELGTSLGITTSYLCAANTDCQVTTIEGCAEAALVAYKNAKQYIGNFDDELPVVLSGIKSLDFVFFDGNHRKEPTLNYFNQCMEKSHERSVFVFDDIYWSPEMKEAWEIIKADQRVTVTVDLFYVGLVFFRKGQAKQDFVIKY
jgi:predicted O-methyltransferase YrrM